jgi:hypothetical protein
MSCSTCTNGKDYVTRIGVFDKQPSFSDKYGCFVHRIIEGTGKPSLLVFCRNDPRAVHNPVRDNERNS